MLEQMKGWFLYTPFRRVRLVPPSKGGKAIPLVSFRPKYIHEVDRVPPKPLAKEQESLFVCHPEIFSGSI